jgi:uncharacterized membrane protein YdbT with pleckstrin-like domain
LWNGSYSPKAMYGSWILAGVGSIAAVVLILIFFRDSVNGWGWLVVLGLIALLWAVLLLKLLYERLSVHYRLTSQRLIHEKGLLSRVTDRIEVIDIDDISFRQTIIDRIFGVGTIEIVSTDRTHPKIVLPGIDDVKDVYAQMDDARRKERVRRGLHIESV